MKKLYLCLIAICLTLTGCGKYNDVEVLEEFKSLLDNTESYYLEGVMELTNNEDIYTYDIKSSYKEGSYYKIELKNKINNHEQIILRNNEGVYVITPSLNKSFKFQSDWPYNNSQVYLLESLIEDISNDEERLFETTSDGYIFTSNVNYPNNEELAKQKVYLNNNFLPTKVEVLDKDNNIEIKMVFNKIDLKISFNDNYFELNSILNTEELPKEDSNNEESTNEENTKKTATIDDIIYPMYLPTGTYLTNEERVSTEDGERLILTFSGENAFTLVEETALYSDQAEIISTSGCIELIGASIAVVNDNSASWFDNNIEYSIFSDSMNKEELLQVVKSISVIPVSK